MVIWKSDPAVAEEAVSMLLKAWANDAPKIRSSVVDNMMNYEGQIICSRKLYTSECFAVPNECVE